MITFSVIIAMYNAEKTLSFTLKSLSAQTYEAFEVLLIDDGSTDSTREIARAYAQKDARFRVIESEHKGHASAMRNIGLREAKNDYIFFLDSDDAIYEHCLQTLAAQINTRNLDMVIFRADEGTFDENGNFTKMQTLGNFVAGETFESGAEAFSAIDIRKQILLCYGCFNVYSRALLTTHKLFQDEYIYMLDDQEYLPRVLFYAGKIAVSGESLYQYRINPLSKSRKLSDKSLHSILMGLYKNALFFHAHYQTMSFHHKRAHVNNALRVFYFYFFDPKCAKRVNQHSRDKFLRLFFSSAKRRAYFMEISACAPFAKKILALSLCYSYGRFLLPAKILCRLYLRLLKYK